MGGHEDGDAELAARAAHEVQHLLAPGGVQPVRGLVEEDEARVVHERLRQLHALLHARGVAAHLAVALLEEAHVAQRLRRAFAGGGAGQAAHAREVGHELRGREVGRQAVVFGHVAGELADGGPFRGHVAVQHARAPGGGRRQPQQDLDERALARAIRPHQPHHARLHAHVQRVQRRHARIALREPVRLDEGHRPSVAGASRERQWRILAPL